MYGQGVFFSDAVNELIDSSLAELEKSADYDSWLSTAFATLT